MSTVTKINMTKTSRIVEYHLSKEQFEEAMKMFPDKNIEVHLKSMIDTEEKIISKTLQVWIDTQTKEQREMICNRFNLRRTSHLANREEVIYVLNFPYAVEDLEDGTE